MATAVVEERKGAARKASAGKRAGAKERRGAAGGKPKPSEKPIGVRNRELGRKGEEAAARFLYRRGYEILERNWTCYAGEADIIAEDHGTLVFVEVKTRKDCQKGFPSEAVSKAKREKYERIALAFLEQSDAVEMPVRFDVVALVVVGRDRALIRHHMNAFSISAM